MPARGRGRVRIVHVPRNLLDDVPNEGSALAEVTLHARDALLGLARRNFLYDGPSLVGS